MTETAVQSVVVDPSGIAVHLPAFDGPLDLLLHLIRTEALDIFDIPISRLTRAYLDYLKALREIEVEPASEFLVMAATLMQIKSRMLLPRPSLDDIEDEDDPRDALMLQLLEYKRFKAVAVELEQRTWLNRDAFGRPRGIDRPSPEPADLAEQNIFRLAEAFRTLVERGHFDAPHDIYVERISIGERIAQIAEILARDNRATFQSLCAEMRYREEIITTFLAVLEMARLKLIRATQGDRLGPLYVEAQVEEIGTQAEMAAGMLE